MLHRAQLRRESLFLLETIPLVRKLPYASHMKFACPEIIIIADSQHSSVLHSEVYLPSQEDAWRCRGHEGMPTISYEIVAKTSERLNWPFECLATVLRFPARLVLLSASELFETPGLDGSFSSQSRMGAFMLISNAITA